MNNKKRIFIGVIILLFLGLFITFAGGEDNEVILKNVEFIDGFNDSIISIQEIQVGEEANIPENPKHDDYVFVGWYLFDNRDVRITDFSNILENLKVIALYSSDKNNNGIADENDNSYTVTFVDGIFNTTINTQTILSGMNAVVPNAVQHDGYIFTGWSDGYTNITKDINITANYVKEDAIDNDDENIILYTVTFIDGDTRAVLKTQIVQEGNAASLPVVPEHEKRIFKEWNGEYKNIRSNRTITAIYVDDLNDDAINDEIQPHYDISYYDYDGTLLKNENVLINMLTPRVDDPVRLNYKFEGWTPEVSELVTKSVDYVATYSPLVDVNRNRMADIDEIKYTVNYAVDGNVVKSFSNLLYGTKTPIYENIPLKSGYCFDGWGEIAEIVSEDVTYNAVFFVDANDNKISDEKEEKYVIRYLDEHNMEIKSYPNLLINTKTPVLDIEFNPVKEGYIFDGWNNFSDVVLQSVDYKAKWLIDSDKDGIADEDEIEIKFVVDDESISTQYLQVNEMPVIPSLIKEKYILSDWSPVVSNATINQIYVAEWLSDINSDGYADINQFKITFKALDKVLVNNYYNSGDKMPIPDLNDIPVKPGYVFVGWGEEVSKTVSESKEYNAFYELDINNNKIADSTEEKYVVRYLDYEGEVIGVYDNLLLKTKTPILEKEKYPVKSGYVFVEWENFSDLVLGNVDYKAKWLVDSDNDGYADENQFEVKFYIENELVSTQFVNENELPVVPTLAKEGWTLSNWNPEVIINKSNSYYAKWVDITNPELNLSYVLSEDSSKAKIIVNTYDNGSGIKSIRYSFEVDSSKIEVGNEFEITANGKYMIFVEDNYGNITSKSIDVSGIEISPNKDKTFKDEYINVSFGEVDGIFVNYSLDMQIDANEGVKIKTIKYYQSDVGLFGGIYDFVTNSSSGKYLTEEQMKSNDYSVVNIELPSDCEKYNLKLSSDSADKFTVLVEYEYNGESVYGLYKVRLAQFVK